MHIGNFISKKLNEIDDYDFMPIVLIFVMGIVVIIMFISVIAASYNSIELRKLEYKKNDIQITNTN